MKRFSFGRFALDCFASLAMTTVLSRRQRDEFRIVEDWSKSALFPIGFGRFDALLRRGHEIPPDMARPVHRRATGEHQSRLRESEDRDAVARPQHEKAARVESDAADIDLAGDNIDAAF